MQAQSIPKRKAKRRASDAVDSATTNSVASAKLAQGLPRFLDQAAYSATPEQQADRTGEQAARLLNVKAIAQQASVDPANVAVHTDEHAADHAQAENARAFTRGDDIYFNRGEYNPSTSAGRALIGHEMAHVAQQRAGLAQGVQRKALSDAPEAARKQIEVPSAPTTIANDTLKELFEKLENGKWGSSRPAPKGVAVELQGIKDEYKTPMTSIAMHINALMNYDSTVTGVNKPLFGPGITLTLQLALAQHGLADGAYRFSWTGDEQSGTIYIEALTGGPKAENAPSAVGGKITVGGLNFEAVGVWSSEQMGHLTRALALIPLEALKQIDGLKFEIDSGTGSVGEEGEYDDTTHTVKLFASAFNISETRFGESPKPVQELAHEIGHAIDLAPMRAAWNKYQRTGKASDLTATESHSGSKWQQDNNKQWQPVERINKVEGDFRRAAQKDGVAVTTSKIKDQAGVESKLIHLKGGVSDYGNTNWTELYAESFALYTTDPVTLNLLRPTIYAYFLKRFARKTA